MSTTPAESLDLRSRLERTLAWREASLGDRAIAGGLRTAGTLDAVELERLATAELSVFTGAGSSFYLARLAAAAMQEVAGLPAVAVPLSEILLRPAGVFAGRDASRLPVVVISRSGSTSEAVSVARGCRARGMAVLAATARGDSPLAGAADRSLVVPEADEAAIVMTRSFLGLATLLLRLVARLAPGSPLGPDLERLPGVWDATDGLVAQALELAAARPGRVVVLGGGAAFGIAEEAVLKLTETSQVPANAWTPLEFRHGPISVCEPGTLVVGLIGGDGADAEARVLAETADLGATTWQPMLAGGAASLHPVARLPLLLHPLQALALGLALERGCDPDAPRHLSQVVVLEGD